MRIILVESGGFMGIGRTTRVEGEHLSPDQRQQIYDLFDSLEKDVPSGLPQAGDVDRDSLYYQLAVELNGKERTLNLGEAATISPSMRIFLKNIIDLGVTDYALPQHAVRSS